LSPPIRFLLRNSDEAIGREVSARRWASWKSQTKSVTALRPARFSKIDVAPAK
jgi:hypothetical protein